MGLALLEMNPNNQTTAYISRTASGLRIAAKVAKFPSRLAAPLPFPQRSGSKLIFDGLTGHIPQLAKLALIRSAVMVRVQKSELASRRWRTSEPHPGGEEGSMPRI